MHVADGRGQACDLPFLLLASNCSAQHSVTAAAVEEEYRSTTALPACDALRWAVGWRPAYRKQLLLQTEGCRSALVNALKRKHAYGP